MNALPKRITYREAEEELTPEEYHRQLMFKAAAMAYAKYREELGI